MRDRFVLTLLVLFAAVVVGLLIGVEASEAIRQGTAELQEALLP